MLFHNFIARNCSVVFAILCIALSITSGNLSSAQSVTTIAGNPLNFSGDNGAATAARLTPTAVVASADGYVYVADFVANRVRRIDPKGIITTFAGNGRYGFSGDGGQAIDAQITGPLSLAIDAGSIYIGSIGAIRKVSATGVITTIAGNGISGNTGADGTPASNAQIGHVNGIDLDRLGNLFFTDGLFGVVRKINVNGNISKIAGTDKNADFVADNVIAVEEPLLNPSGILVDNHGGVIVAVSGQNRVRKISALGIITTIAGSGMVGFIGDNGSATAASLYSPYALTRDGTGGYLVTETGSERIRRVNANGVISTIVGRVQDAGTMPLALAATIDFPIGLYRDHADNLFVTSEFSNAVYKIGSGGGVTVYAGGNGDGGAAISAKLNGARAVMAHADGTVFIADQLSHRVRKIGIDGTITTFAGNGISGFSGDHGMAMTAELTYPSSLTVDSAGAIYIGTSGAIRRVSTDGVITTIAGTGVFGNSSFDGAVATTTQIGTVQGMCFDAEGNLFFTDYSFGKVFKINTAGKIFKVAGTQDSFSFTGDDVLATLAPLSRPAGILVFADGSIIIAVSAQNRVRKIDPKGIISTIAGPGLVTGTGDYGLARAALLETPFGLAHDGVGGYFVSELDGNRVRRVTANGVITPVIGDGVRVNWGDNGPAVSARINSPAGLWFGGNSNLFIASSLGNSVRKISPSMFTINARNHTGLWWNASESGWGINFNQQGGALFGTLFTHATDDRAHWLVMSNGTKQADNSYSGDLYQTTGSAFNSEPFVPLNNTNIKRVGKMTVAFTSDSSATLTYDINGSTIVKEITPQIFGPLSACGSEPSTTNRQASMNFQDLWWDPRESGWGVNVTHQGNILFATLFVYDILGRNTWLVMSSGNKQSDGSYRGDLFRVVRPIINVPPSSGVSVTKVGSMQFNFQSGIAGVLKYSWDGVDVTKAIQRQVFGAQVPVCQ